MTADRPHDTPAGEGAASSDSPAPQGDAGHRAGDSLLETIARRTGVSPKITLHDGGDDDPTPIVDPRVREFQEQLRGSDRGKYQVLGEIARGGMGVVLRGHDNELGRDVAMKVVHGELAERGEVIERFVEEAQIGGQLQHPGIVPVYELGLMGDQRPYFTMKLIKGRTLAKMLARRKSPEEDRVRFLTIFEAVCQTMAYAHSKGVIHRDLKPANVMVGGFGEVQVVDWGLSKVLGGGGVADERAANQVHTIIATVRSGPGSDSLAGNVLGTPAYMAPEQARGEVEQLDERTDVFALGAILCELLTGAPPYGTDDPSVLQRAARADLTDARARIEASTAPADLKELCLACLTPAKQARPSGAEELAQGIHAHITRLETAAHEAQLAAAEGRLQAERSRRRFQVTLVAALALIGAGSGWWWLGEQRRERELELTSTFAGIEAEVMQRSREGAFEQAVDTARGGRRLVEAGEGGLELRRRAERLVLEAEEWLRKEEERAAEQARERRLFDFLTDVGMRQVVTGVAVTNEELDRRYTEAFRDFGLDLEAEDLGRRLTAVRDTDLGVRLASGFDAWARLLRRTDSAEPERIELLNGIGLDLDSDPLRTTVRLALVEHDRTRLIELAEELDVTRTAPETIVLLATSLADFFQFEEARELLVQGADQYPTSFVLNYEAGRALYRADRRSQFPDAHGKAIVYLRAALAIRPDLAGLHMLLGDVYRHRGDEVGAYLWGRKAYAMAPDHGWNLTVLAMDAVHLGLFEEAHDWFRRALAEYSSDSFATTMLSFCDWRMGNMSTENFLARSREHAEAGRDGGRISQAFAYLYELNQPQQALEVLEPLLPQGMPDDLYWLALARARAALGDGAGTLDALERGSRNFSLQQAPQVVQILLLIATTNRLRGDDASANLLARIARMLFTELTVGAENLWSQTATTDVFALDEKLATGR